MNADIKEYIASQANMIKMYVDKLGESDPAVQACRSVLARLEAAGEKYGAIYEFMGDPNFQPLSAEFATKMMELATKASQARSAPASGGATGGTGHSGGRAIPTAAQAALGYHKAFEAIPDKAKLPQTCAVYERVFAIEKESVHAGEFVARLATEGLFTKMAAVQMIEQYSALTAQAESVSLPTMAFHNECVLETAKKAKSAIELEYETQRLFELNQLELRLDRGLLTDLFDVLGNPVSSYLLNPSEENRAAVEAAYRFTADFFSVDIEMLFRIPRVRDYVRFLAEGGNKGGGRKMSPETWETDFRGAIAACLKNRPPVVMGPPSRRYAMLWGKSIPLEQFGEAIRHPVRPQSVST